LTRLRLVNAERTKERENERTRNENARFARTRLRRLPRPALPATVAAKAATYAGPPQVGFAERRRTGLLTTKTRRHEGSSGEPPVLASRI
jgi:hypothetical protein